MTVKTKWIAILSLILAMAITSSLFGAAQVVKLERQSMLAGEVEREVSFLKNLFEVESDRQAQRVLEAISLGAAFKSGTITEDHFKSDLDAKGFVFVAQMSLDQGTWKIDFAHSSSRGQGQWSLGAMHSALQNLPLARAEGRNVVWHRVAGPQEVPIFLQIVRFHADRPTVAIGAFPSQTFSGLVDAQLGHNGDLAVVDERGYALLYSEARYVGAQIDRIPYVRDGLNQKLVLGHLNTKDLQDRSAVVGVARVPRTNLYAFVLRPVDAVLPMVSGYVQIGIVLILIGVVAMFLFVWVEVKPLMQAFNYAVGVLRAVAHGRAVSYLPEGNPYVGDLRSDVEKLISDDASAPPTYIREATEQQVDMGKMGAYKEISLGLSQALKEPLASILGQAQLARAKSGAESVKDHMIVIEREARRARDTLENVLRLTGEERFPRSAVDMQEVMMASLASLKNLFAGAGVKITKNLEANVFVQAHAGQLQTVFEELLKNAVDSMTDSANKEIRVSSKVTSRGVEVRIEDTGVGVRPEHLSKVFDPFFTTHASGDHKGLGLTVAKGILKGIGGVIHLEAMPKGTSVVVTLPSQAAQQTLLKKEGASEQKKVSLEQPLTGSELDRLPSAPAHDEVTLVGIEQPFSAEELPDGLELPVERTQKS